MGQAIDMPQILRCSAQLAAVIRLTIPRKEIRNVTGPGIFDFEAGGPAVVLPELLKVETYKMQRSAQGAQVRRVGLARAEAYQRQVQEAFLSCRTHW